MNWIKDGEQVSGIYYGHVFEGVVTESRVKYGGGVQYTVALHNPINMGSRWMNRGKDDLRSVVLVESKDLVIL